MPPVNVCSTHSNWQWPSVYTRSYNYKTTITLLL